MKAGDRILFGKYSGTDIKIDGDEYMIMREDEVLGVLEGGTEESEGVGSEPRYKRRFKTWQQNKLYIAKIPARRSCAA